MPQAVLSVCAVEFLLLLCTSLLLVQPQFLFPPKGIKRKRMAAGIGLVALFMTFIWSIILGIFLSVPSLSS